MKVDVRERVQRSFEYFDSNPTRRDNLKTGDGVKRVLGLTKGESVTEVHTTRNQQGERATKLTEQFRGIPVFDTHILLTWNEKTGELINDGHGHFVQKIDEDVASISAEISKDAALQRVMTMEDDDPRKVTITQANVTLYIYLEKETMKAYLAYMVKYVVQRDAGIAKPTYMINANNGDVFFDYNGLQSYLVEGVGGNEKLGRYVFGKDRGLQKLDVTRTNDGKCHLQNEHIRVVDMDHSTTISQRRPAFSYDCNTLINDTKNGGYSPLYDAMYFGTKVFNMFREWSNEIPIRTSANTQIPLLVHYGVKVENAFWDGTHAVFGDGGEQYYPQPTFDIIAHEMGHGFTGDQSGLIYRDMSGGMNEAYSDMTGEAFEVYLNFTVDWKFDYYSTKGSGTLRYFETPSRDGGSIDYASQFSGQGPHTSSGVYRKAFYHLATTAGWGIKKAWQVATLANSMYWTAASTFDEGACGMERAATWLGYDNSSVTKAFEKVEVACTGGHRRSVQQLLVGVSQTVLETRKGSWCFF